MNKRMAKKVVYAAIVMAGMMMFAGCSDKEQDFTQKNYTVAAENVTGVCIDVRDREIEILQAENEAIQIEYFESEKEFYNISVSEDNVLAMTAAENKQWKDYIGSKSPEDYRKISVRVPEMLLEKLTLKTTNENLVLSPLNVKGEAVLDANGGNISFENVNVGKGLVLDVKNGNIEGTIVGGYDDFNIQCEIKKGDSNLPSEKKGGDKKLQVSANNGDVNIEFTKE